MSWFHSPYRRRLPAAPPGKPRTPNDDERGRGIAAVVCQPVGQPALHASPVGRTREEDELPETEGVKLVKRLGGLIRDNGRGAWHRVRDNLLVAAQAGLAATLSWVVARQLLDNSQPTFAPAAAVGVIAAAMGNRFRRAVELIGGVVLGLVIGDLLIALLDTGPLQTGLIVFLAVSAAAAVRGSGALLVQAGVTGALVATLTPTAPNVELPRTLNALVGGVVGLFVVLVLAPLNPLRAVRRIADPALDRFADEMTAAAGALASGDAAEAEAVLDRMREAEATLDQLLEVVTAADEVVRLSPLRWRRRRALDAYRDGIEHMERAFRNSRGMVRRINTTLRDGEPVPADLPAGVEHFGEAVRLLHREFLATREPVKARERALESVREAGRAYRQGLGFSGAIVASQLRAVASDLLRATGLPRDEARSLVGQAAATDG
ncbi:FUSC family protein [Micromonospora sp. WMMD1120]|uniref:FUSC family protein n=1 Tax=Micromonospora sp. WMMD1120 TaxID=3016106 RepID=UPI002415D245|nr:FUSC family protein [Micromonospora sp. WMMD1120]MDG4811066.1 FUSC family protein [Micromonospora sp. WMMD1120]